MKRIVFFAIGLFFLHLGRAYALPDGFGSAQKIEGKHFIIHYALDIYPSVLARQLNLSAADEILAGQSASEESRLKAPLPAMVDTLFLRVCDILDMPLYSFKGDILVCRAQKELNIIYYNLFGKELSAPSFYIFTENIIYISRDSFSREILGHEIAHAIISHYFVVQPSIKIQEVLSMYVEYQLRKQ